MSTETRNFEKLALWLEAIGDRLDQLKVQVRGLVTSEKVEAREFVLNRCRSTRHVRSRMAS